MKDIFNLKGTLVCITGGAGLLGKMHAEAIIESGGNAVIADLDKEKAEQVAEELNSKYGSYMARPQYMDVTDKKSIEAVAINYPRVNVLINNAAQDPKVDASGKDGGNFETMKIREWRQGIDSMLTGTFLCSQVFCRLFVKQGGGSIINISSDLGVIAPDQRIYDKGKKPITYSAAKHGVIGITKYLATYFADKNIRVNSLSPGGVYTDQPPNFVDKLSKLIPMGRMADKEEYKGAIVFLCSKASSYMTGSNIIIDGGRSVW